jgi:hypothetical protein
MDSRSNVGVDALVLEEFQCFAEKCRRGKPNDHRSTIHDDELNIPPRMGPTLRYDMTSLYPAYYCCTLDADPDVAETRLHTCKAAQPHRGALRLSAFTDAGTTAKGGRFSLPAFHTLFARNPYSPVEDGSSQLSNSSLLVAARSRPSKSTFALYTKKVGGSIPSPPIQDRPRHGQKP